MLKLFKKTKQQKITRLPSNTRSCEVLYSVVRIIRMFHAEASAEHAEATHRIAAEKAFAKIQLCRELEQVIGECLNCELNNDIWEDLEE